MKIQNVEDIYPLSPMQQGILFHSIYAPRSQVFHFQFRCTFQGQLDLAAFQAAWQQTVNQHAILRTGFFWQGLDKPMQVVRRQVTIPWSVADWRNKDGATQAADLAALWSADLARPFDLNQAPLMRLILVRLAEDHYHFTWSHHHLLLDGWSTPLVLQDLFAHYAGEVSGQPAPPQARPAYRDFIAWLQAQEVAQGESYWRTKLAGITAPTPLGIDQAVVGRGDLDVYEQQSLTVDETVTEQLKAQARRHKLTLNTLVQGAWALLLSHYSGEQEVLFGATVSGREANLPHIDEMVGVLINTLPMRVQLDPAANLLDWLQNIQQEAFAMRRYEYIPQSQLQQWSDLAPGQPLYESVFVFANYPLGEVLTSGELTMSDITFFEKTNAPLMIEARPGRQLWLLLTYNQHRFADEAITQLGQHLHNLLLQMAEELDVPLAALALEAPVVAQQLIGDFNAAFV